MNDSDKQAKEQTPYERFEELAKKALTTPRPEPAKQEPKQEPPDKKDSK